MFYLGLGKTLFNSSACSFFSTKEGLDIELILSERITRKKANGAWPEQAICNLQESIRAQSGEIRGIAENRDVSSPKEYESILASQFPFYDYLLGQKLSNYVSHFNPNLEFVTHHRCHAMAAVAMSPFDRCLILVMDGAGSRLKQFEGGCEEAGMGDPLNQDSHEECSLYLHDHGKLRCVYKRWQDFIPSRVSPEHTFSQGAGIFYESAAQYIFNSKRAAGKVMGLAGFGQAGAVQSRVKFLEDLNWGDAFHGKTKQDWELSGRFQHYANIAATVQQNFEEGFMALAEKIRIDFPSYDQLILTGGCALNCTANKKLLEKKLFNKIYVPPFPGDECIGFGAASFLYFSRFANRWDALPYERQHGYFGPKSSIPNEKSLERVFAGYRILHCPSIVDHVASLLSNGHILAWFQGRSESGPRALGNRSILANPTMPNLKNRLNQEIKFREAFRPYGASCTREAIAQFFDVIDDFESPFMSFAVNPRPAYKELFREICHIDGTSRVQSVRRGQNPSFHELLQKFGAKTGFPCLLNTSLNVMGEPIVETVQDAKRFLDNTPVHGLAIGNFYIQRTS